VLSKAGWPAWARAAIAAAPAAVGAPVAALAALLVLATIGFTPAEAAPSPNPSFSQESPTLKADRIEFSPLEFGPGQIVEVSVLVLGKGREGAGGAETLVLKPGSGLKLEDGKADPEIREVRLSSTKAGRELRVSFIPWSPGPGAIAALSVGGLLFPPIPYSAASLLGPDDKEPGIPRPQRLPQGMEIYLYGLAGMVLLLCLALVALVAYVLPSARRIAARWKAAQAFRRLSITLEFLATGVSREADPARRDTVAFLGALVRALRLYLAERIERSCPALTADELEGLPESTFPEAGMRGEAASLIREADRARYSGFFPPPSELLAAVDRTRRLGAAIEETLDARL
jgi:hypothetical protein